MTQRNFTGVYAAMLTPRLADDSVDKGALAKLTRFLVTRKVTQFALNGATGEFCLTTPEQLRVLLATVHEVSDGEGRILCGVGAPGIAGTLALVRAAESEGVGGLLLPMPSFFQYRQEDLDLYCRKVAGATNLPILLYNLPQFTSGLEKETVRKLILEVPNILGIKDSSGSLEIMRYLTGCGVNACRIIGNDAVLPQAMLEGLCDGVISGVACVLPELILELHEQSNAFNQEGPPAMLELLIELIEQLNQFPTPWGLKWTAQARGIMDAAFSQPVTLRRRGQAETFTHWLSKHVPAVLSSVSFSSGSDV